MKDVKKVGILTFHCAYNYGAILQAYGLYKYIESIGKTPEFVDYAPEYLTSMYRWFKPNRIISKNPIRAIQELVLLPGRYLRYKSFEKFSKNNFSISSRVVERIPNEYSAILYGSDQIWNPQITNGYSDFYWGKKGQAKNIAYAASMGIKLKDDSARETVKGLLDNFSSIGVREEYLALELSKLTDKKVSVVMDPTFLLPAISWDKIAIAPKITEKYVLLFQVRMSEKAEKIAEAIAKRDGLKLLRISTRPEQGNDFIFGGAGPSEFLGLIQNAEFVVCTSFHGTAFSIIFRKEFYSVLLNDGHDGRVNNLLKICKLQSRGIQDVKEINTSKIDWLLDDFESEVAASKEYLKSSL